MSTSNSAASGSSSRHNIVHSPYVVGLISESVAHSMNHEEAHKLKLDPGALQSRIEQFFATERREGREYLVLLYRDNHTKKLVAKKWIDLRQDDAVRGAVHGRVVDFVKMNVKKAKNRNRHELRLAREREESEEGAIQGLVRKELLKNTALCFAKLDEEQQEILRLQIVAGFTYEAIAKETGLSKRQIVRRRRNAMNYLKSHIRSDVA